MPSLQNKALMNIAEGALTLICIIGLLAQAGGVLWVAYTMITTGEVAIWAVAIWAVAALATLAAGAVREKLTGRESEADEGARNESSRFKKGQIVLYAGIGIWCGTLFLVSAANGNPLESFIWGLAVAAAYALFANAWKIAHQ